MATISIAGGNNVTLSTAASAFTVSGANLLSAGVSSGGNTQGNTQVSTGSRLVLVGTNNITLSQATAAGATTISISGGAGGAAQGTQSNWDNAVQPNGVQQVMGGHRTSYMQPFYLAYPVSYGFLRFPGASLSHGASTTLGTTANTTVTASMATTYNLQIFTQGTGASSLSLMEFASTSHSMAYRISVQEGAGASSASWTQQISYPMSSTAQAVFTTASNNTTNTIAVSTQSMTAFSGRKVFDLPWATSLPEGDYWLGFGFSSASATQVAAMSVLTSQLIPMSFAVLTMSNVYSGMGEIGGASNASMGVIPGLGNFSNAGNGKTASITIGNVTATAPNQQFKFMLVRTA